MADLIDRQAALNALIKDERYNEDIPNRSDGVRDAIITVLCIPSVDAVPVVRCKDCKHWIPYDWMMSEVWRSVNIADYDEIEISCDLCDMHMGAKDYCSRWERREENGTDN